MCRLPPPFSSIGKRLAGEAAREDVDFAEPGPEVRFRDVVITYAFGEPVFQHAPPEGVYLAVEGVAPAHHGCCYLRPSDAREKACVRELLVHCSTCFG